jgi:hypothetical protein
MSRRESRIQVCDQFASLSSRASPVLFFQMIDITGNLLDGHRQPPFVQSVANAQFDSQRLHTFEKEAGLISL